MAFSTKISFVPRDNGNNVVCFDNVDFGFYQIGNSFMLMRDNLYGKYQKLNFREISIQISNDYVSVLNNDEIIEFLSSSLEILNNNPTLKYFIQNGFKYTQYNWAIIEIYEWESGFG